MDEFDLAVLQFRKSYRLEWIKKLQGSVIRKMFLIALEIKIDD